MRKEAVVMSIRNGQEIKKPQNTEGITFVNFTGQNRGIEGKIINFPTTLTPAFTIITPDHRPAEIIELPVKPTETTPNTKSPDTDFGVKKEKKDKSLTRLLERVDRATSIMRRSGCKCGYEARNNPNAMGCRSRFCVKKREDSKINSVRFINATIRRGSQRVSYAPKRVESAQTDRSDSNKKN